MPSEQVVDGRLVQQAIDACYLWRNHVMKFDAFEEFKKKHNLKVVGEYLVFSGAFMHNGQPFAIIKIDESPYGVEFSG